MKNAFCSSVARLDSVEKIEQKYSTRLRSVAEDTKKGLFDETLVSDTKADLNAVNNILSAPKAFNGVSGSNYFGSAADVAVLLTKTFTAGMAAALSACESMLFLQRCVDFATDNDKYTDMPSTHGLLDSIESIARENGGNVSKKVLEKSLIEVYTNTVTPLDVEQAESIVDDLVQCGILNAADDGDFITDDTPLRLAANPSIFFDMEDKFAQLLTFSD